MMFLSLIAQNTAQRQQLFYGNFRAIFPKTVSNLKKLLFCIVSYIHALCTDYLITVFIKK